MKLMVIDGNSMINRAFYGIRLLTNSAGVPTNAIHGFFNTYLKLVREEQPDSVCVCFDLKIPTFRHKMYSEYKAGRKSMPEELAKQLPMLKEALGYMGIRCAELPGYEADDLLGTFAARACAAGDSCVIVTGDRDSLQFIETGATVCLVTTKMGRTEAVRYDRNVFMEAYSGLAPAALVDLKAIMGDKSDNIPGVPGIGEKGAIDLLTKYGTLDGVYEHAEDESLSASVRKKLAAGRDLAFLSRDLAKGVTDAPLMLEDVPAPAEDKGKLYEFFAALELNSLIKSMDLHPSADAAPTAEIKKLNIRRADAAELKAALSVPGRTFDPYLPGFAVVCTGEEVLICDADDDMLAELGTGAVSPNIFEAKPFIKMLADMGKEPIVPGFDPQIAAYLLDPNSSDHSFSACCTKYLGMEAPAGMMTDEDIAERSALSHQLMERLKPLVHKNGLEDLMQNVELPLMPVLAVMESAGICLDKEKLSAFGDRMSADARQLEAEIFDLAGHDFNIGSPKQLGVVLFEEIGLKAIKKTRTGYSTDAETLGKLAHAHPIIEKILEWRKVQKLKSTYVDGFLPLVRADGRIHSTFNQTVTATGRLSSTEPNLQNIPVRREDEIRRCFTAGPGSMLIDADYSQIELRILAHMAGDGIMLDAFRNNEDIHRVTASQVFGVSPEEVTSLMRSRAKAVNFGIVYGISAFSLSEDIGVYPKEAQAYIDAYFAKYYGVKAYRDEIKRKAKEDGYVTTLYGRRRPIPELASSNFNVRSFGERVALNTPIQGTAADIIKIAMIKVYNALKKECPEARLILQVHDELIVECPEEKAELAAAIMEREMEAAADLEVKLEAECSIGATWYDAKK